MTDKSVRCCCCKERGSVMTYKSVRCCSCCKERGSTTTDKSVRLSCWKDKYSAAALVQLCYETKAHNYDTQVVVKISPSYIISFK